MNIRNKIYCLNKIQKTFRFFFNIQKVILIFVNEAKNKPKNSIKLRKHFKNQIIFFLNYSSFFIVGRKLKKLFKEKTCNKYETIIIHKKSQFQRSLEQLTSSVASLSNAQMVEVPWWLWWVVFGLQCFWVAFFFVNWEGKISIFRLSEQRGNWLCNKVRVWDQRNHLTFGDRGLHLYQTWNWITLIAKSTTETNWNFNRSDQSSCEFMRLLFYTKYFIRKKWRGRFGRRTSWY